MFKTMQIKKADKMLEKSAAFNPRFDQEVFVEGFDDMRIFLQPGCKNVPAPSGVECTLCTVTISSSSPIIKALDLIPNKTNKVILVGKSFLKLGHAQKMVLLRAEAYRQNQKITNILVRAAGLSSTSLDREIATRQALSSEFKPKLVEKTLGHRDRLVVKSTTTVAKSIYLQSDKADHYKKPNHGFMKNGKKSYYSIISADAPLTAAPAATEEKVPEATGEEPTVQPA